VRRGSSLLVGVTANEVLGVRGALDQVSNGVDVDELLLGDIPTVHDEVDVEPHLGNLGLRDFLLDLDDLLDDLVDNLLVVLVHADTVGETPLAGFLADVPGETEGTTEDTVHLAVDKPMLLIRLSGAALTVKVVTDKGAADIEQDAELIVQAELVDQAGIESRGRKDTLLGEAQNDTTAGISVNPVETVGLETAEDVHQVGVSEGIDIQETSLLESKLLIGAVTELGIDVSESFVGLETGELVGTGSGMTLIKSFERPSGNTETETEARRSPLGQISVNGREGEHTELVADLPVILTIVELGTQTKIQLPVLPETVGEHGVLLHDRGGDDLTVGGGGLFHDGDGVLILAPGHFDILSKDTCRRDKSGRSNQDK